MTKAWRLAWLPLLLVAGPACAHAPVPGIEGFYIGLMHPFSTPPQALLMIGLGLLVGGYAIEKGRCYFVAFPLAIVLGLIVGSIAADLDTAMFAVAFLACVMAALAPGRLHPLAIAVIAVGGFLIGVASLPDDGPVRDRLFTMVGSILGASIGLLYLLGISVLVRERFYRAWVGVAFRVLAAWLGAISLLMLALGLANSVPT